MFTNSFNAVKPFSRYFYSCEKVDVTHDTSRTVNVRFSKLDQHGQLHYHDTNDEHWPGIFRVLRGQTLVWTNAPDGPTDIFSKLLRRRRRVG